jgi:hypothetical protein
MMSWSIVDASGATYGPFDSLWSLAKLVECTEMFHPLVAVQTIDGDPRPRVWVCSEALEKAHVTTRKRMLGDANW